MDDQQPIRVVVNEQWSGTAVSAADRPDHMLVRFDDGRQVIVHRSLLASGADGRYRLAIEPAMLQGLSERSAGERVVIPVIAEELEIERRQVSTGAVRVHKRVHEREELVDVPVVAEEAEVVRVPVGRMVDQAPEVRMEDEQLVIPILEEVLVVEKRLMLKEELRIAIKRSSETQRQRVSLRSEEAVIERAAPDDRAAPGTEGS